MTQTSLRLATVAAQIADAKKAEDVVVIDLTSVSDMADYFVICTTTNNPLKDYVVEEIEAGVTKLCGEAPLSVEGRANDGWILLDYGRVVVHVFLPDTREYYRLERLWGDAPRVEIDFEA